MGRIIHLCGVVTARKHSKHAGWLRVERLLGWLVGWYIPQTIAARSAAPTWRSFGLASARPCRWGYLANWLAGLIIHHCGIAAGNNKSRTAQVGRIIHLCGVVTARKHSKHAGWLRVERLLVWLVGWYIPQTIAARSAAPTWRSFGPASARPCRWGYLANWLAGLIIHHCGIDAATTKTEQHRWAVSSTFVALSQHGSTASMLGG